MARILPAALRRRRPFQNRRRPAGLPSKAPSRRVASSPAENHPHREPRPTAQPPVRALIPLLRGFPHSPDFFPLDRNILKDLSTQGLASRDASAVARTDEVGEEQTMVHRVSVRWQGVHEISELRKESRGRSLTDK